ncbi:hypothetical protein PsorP6_015482 [Peronosclerospora sorghi]|uniref:Uncharacterized protein n=1 Tax=Peronosclerospora sorghi TaxID=230839 RepID=A0ACC0WRP5_9STRA|nr:hypothetical protein PsorP6_015482 [Peronosclerospora sorghi]
MNPAARENLARTHHKLKGTQAEERTGGGSFREVASEVVKRVARAEAAIKTAKTVRERQEIDDHILSEIIKVLENDEQLKQFEELIEKRMDNVESQAVINLASGLHNIDKAESGSSSDQSHKIYFTDVLTFEYLSEAQLLDGLTHLERYTGILVTSPRSAIAVSNAVNKLALELKQKVFKKLQSMSVFSVGAATSRELLPLGVICKGDDAGSADTLSEYLHHNGGFPADCKEKPMMFLCGDKRRDVLPDSFRPRGLPLEELVVYQTCALQNIAIPDECRVPDWVVFFSPSRLEPTSATDLQEHAVATEKPFWEADVTAPKPTPESLADAIFAFQAEHKLEKFSFRDTSSKDAATLYDFRAEFIPSVSDT